MVFNNRPPTIQPAVLKILDLVASYPPKQHIVHVAMGFFDGIAQRLIGGVRAVLYINRDHHFLIQLGCGTNTNSRAELLAAYGLLFMANSMGLPELRVLGDSKMVVDRLNGRNHLHVLNLDHWCRRIHTIIRGFISFSCQHIYQEHNQLADFLSKKALDLQAGHLIVQEFEGDILSHENSVNIFS